MTRGARGYTYIGLLILIAIIAVAATATIQLGSIVQRRDAELQLLYVGNQFQIALKSYRDGSPTGTPPFPKELTQLLKDPRYPTVRRHLRNVPVDPLTGNNKWGLIRSPEGWIIGVHSLSEARPIKIGNFDPEFASFEGKTKVNEWIFSALPVLLQQKPGDMKPGDQKGGDQQKKDERMLISQPQNPGQPAQRQPQGNLEE